MEEMISATVEDILNKKGNKVITINADEPIVNAVELMVRHNIGAVLVVTEGGICGIFTERDYMRKVAGSSIDTKKTRVMDISSCNLVAIDPSYSVTEAMAIMTEQHCRHLPVMEKDELVGLVSIGDLVKQASIDQATHIHYLTDYLTGKYPA
jgi:CBS domain-containing protein